MKILKYLVLAALVVLALGLAVPERIRIPVAGATPKDWNAQSFWFEPWGTSGVHKGIDIFGKTGTPVLSTTDGMVLFTGEIAKGGKVVLVLGPRWRLHYFAHLDRITTDALAPVASGSAIGTVGASGNAQGKPPHLHYSIVRLLPAPWQIDGATQGVKKAFFIDPGAYLKEQ
ncbi:metalloendopeptidase-like membrane protein [Acidovorax sp. CF316]|uniref:M23 family metallopeptidase n=1 Tax=Acidovorax sp. CF316 TaxID=1144317 RepID=UPI00026BCFDD|nr:M23 family metallopeptidase [Acidovorax sp. CF316]EJE51234.1 metalloendopeptidase-like membrane protein [Acidovorax sp. CF316]